MDPICVNKEKIYFQRIYQMKLQEDHQVTENSTEEDNEKLIEKEIKEQVEETERETGHLNREEEEPKNSREKKTKKRKVHQLVDGHYEEFLDGTQKSFRCNFCKKTFPLEQVR